MPDKIAEMMETLNDLKERVEEIENILGVENDEDEEFDVAGEYTVIRGSDGKIIGVKPIGGSRPSSAPMDGPWSLDPPEPTRIQN